MFLELDIEIKGNYDEPIALSDDSNSTFDLGDETSLEIRNDYQVLDGGFANMPDGYPLVTQKSGKTLFTFEFEYLGSNFQYDPVIKFESESGTTSAATVDFALLSLIFSFALSALLIL